jgi:hypothetical protein
MRRILATLALSVFVLGGAAAPAFADPKPRDTTAQQKRACERAGGTFIDLDGLAKICLLPKA